MKRGRAIWAILAGGAAVLLASGCGTTPRDDFYQARAIKYPGKPGSGAVFVSRSSPADSPRIAGSR
jgi:hypothetical protein